MNIYLSISSRPDLDYISSICDPAKLNILCSFEYRASMKQYKPCHCRNFMADSGAFTAMNAGKKISMDYVDSYIKWINDNDIHHFIEMDLDEVIGYEATLDIRKRIETKTGKKVMPCWHLQRGADGWKRMCDEYPYVAISLSRLTNTSKWLVKNKFAPLRFFLHEANKRGAKVHALGCNDLNLLRQYHFFSADSSTHTLGNRYGNILYFNNGVLQQVNKQRKYRIDKNKADTHNIQQMIEVMKYAETHL